MSSNASDFDGVGFDGNIEQDVDFNVEEEEEEELLKNPFALPVKEAEFAREARELEAMGSLGEQLRAVVWRTLVVALPIGSLQLFGFLMLTVDVLFMRNSADGLAAMGLSAAIQSAIGFLAFNIGTMGLYTLASQGHGRDDRDGNALLLQTALVCATAMNIPVALLLWFSADIINLMPGVQPELLPLLEFAGRVAVPSTVLETWYRVLEAALINNRRLAPCVVLQAAALGLNVALDAAAVWGLALGFHGVCLVTLWVRFVRLFFAFAYLIFYSGLWSPWSRQAVSLASLKTYLLHSIPASLAVCLEIVGFEGMSFLAAAFGTVASGAHVAAFQILVVAFFLIFGITNGSSVCFGNLLGAGEMKAAMLYGQVGAAMAMLVALVNATVILLLGPSVLSHLFSSDPAVQELTAELLMVAALIHVPDTVNQILGSLLRACGRSSGSMASMIIGVLFFSAPLAYLLGFVAHLKVPGIWYGLLAGTCLIVLLQAFFFLRVRWTDVLREAAVDFADRE